MTNHQLISITSQAHRYGWYATRQSILRRGGTMHDVAWALVTILLIQGA